MNLVSRVRLAWAAPAAVLLAGLVLASGCSTPASRIKRQQALFESLPPDTQALIREGKVGIGFTPEMVKLAVGDPDQRWIRTDANGRTEIWSYTTYDDVGGAPFFRGYYHRHAGVYPFFYDDYMRAAARPREYFKVAFSGGRVVEVTQESR